MLNQTLLNTDTRARINIDGLLDSGVSVIVYDKNNEVKVPLSAATQDDDDETLWYFDIDSTKLITLGTYTLEWVYELSGNEKRQEITYLDVLSDSQRRYCYQRDVLLRLYDMLLPSSFNIGEYTKRASMEIDRALQGYYEIPLVPSSTHDNYLQDVTSLIALCADIAAGYAIEDISISRGQSGPNMKKAVAYAELNRYVKREKVFSSVPKRSGYTDVAYQLSKPRVAGPGIGESKTSMDADPMEQAYNNLTP